MITANPLFLGGDEAVSEAGSVVGVGSVVEDSGSTPIYFDLGENYQNEHQMLGSQYMGQT